MSLPLTLPNGTVLSLAQLDALLANASIRTINIPSQPQAPQDRLKELLGKSASELASEGYLNPDGTVRLIVAFDPGHSGEPAKRLNAFHRNKNMLKNRIASLRGRVKKELPVISGFSADVPLSNIASLAAEGVRVYLDKIQRIHLNESVPLIGGSELQAAGWNGSGIVVAVIDTGIDKNHPDLAGRIAREYDFYNNDTDASDDNGHGTHVASIVGGTGAASGGQLKGVAPNVTFWAAKACSAGGSCPVSAVIAAIDWASNYSGGCVGAADILQMSLGGPGDESDPVAIAAENAVACGVVFVISAGNDGPDYGTVNSPALAPNVIGVGASNKSDAIASFSSRGPSANYFRIKPDVLAPGVGIVAARANGTSMGSPLNSSYTRASGTSMSAPHVAGAAALLLQAHPAWTNWQVKSALLSTANDLGYDPWTQGTGRINLTRAFNAQLATVPQTIDFGKTNASLVWAELTIANLNTSSPITLALTATNATELFTNASFDIASLNETSLVVPAASNRTVNFSLDLSAARGTLSGYILINDTASNEIYRVAYGVFATPCGALNASLILTEDANTAAGSCFRIIADNVTLDCAGHAVRTLSGGDYGVRAADVTNITIKNCRIENFDHGVLFENVSNSLVEDVVVINATWYGFLQTDSPNNTFNSLNASHQWVGFASWYSNGTNLSNSFFENDTAGVNIFWEAGDFLDNNWMNGSTYDLLVGNTIIFYIFPLHFGVIPYFYMHNITEGNMVEGLPVRYIVGARDYAFPEDTGFAAFINSHNITAENLSLSHAEALIIVNSTDSRVRNVTLNGTFNGIEIGNSTNITIESSLIYDTTAFGVEIHNASAAVLSNNITLTSGDVVLMENVTDTLVADNLLSNSIKGIAAHDVAGRNVTIVNNSITAPLYGIYTYSSNNILYANNSIFNASLYGIYINSNGNIFHNTTLQDSKEVFLYGSTANNFSLLTVNNSPSYGVRFSSASGNIISESLIANSSLADIRSTASSDNLIINSSFNISNLSFGDASSVLRVGWWARVNVTDENGDPQDAALVYVRNSLGGVVATATTDANGLTPLLAVPELVITSASSTNVTPHTFAAFKGPYAGFVTANISQDLLANITIAYAPSAWCGVPLVTNLTLEADILYNDSCILIDADNVTLDCAGHAIRGNNTPGTIGIAVNGRRNVAIKNCVVAGYDTALSLNRNSSLSDYPTIVNNTLANSSSGLFSDGARWGLLANNTLYNNSDGADLAASLGWSLFNNTYEGNTVGAWLYANASLNNFTREVFANNYVGVYFTGSSGNVIESSAFVLNTYDIASGSSALNSLLNTTFNSSALWFGDNLSQLQIYWYASAFVNASTGQPVAGANVTATDALGNIVYSQLTNSSGHTQPAALKEAAYSAPANISFTPHNFTATYPGMSPAARALTLNASQMVELMLFACGTNLTFNYTLAGDLNASGDCINFAADNLAFDCAGHAIYGDGSGVAFNTSGNNAIVKNCRITGFDTGILVVGSSGALVSGNIVSETTDGVYLDGANATAVLNNTLFNIAGNGIDVVYASGNTLAGNIVANTSGYGFLLANATNNTLTNNTAFNDSSGFALFSSEQNILSGNNALHNAYYGFLLANATNNTLTNNTAQDNLLDGFAILPPSLNTLVDNTARGNRDGFSLNSTSSETLLGNDALANTRHGFLIFNGSDINLSDNAARENGGNGFAVENSSNIAMWGNDAISNGGYGVYITNSTNISYTNGRICGNGIYDDSGSNFAGNDLLCFAPRARKRRAAFIELEVSAPCAGKNASIAVRDPRTGSPVAGAEVRVALQFGFWSEVARGTTDDSGLFVFVPPRAGSYEASALAIGYASLPLSFTVEECGPAPTPAPNITAAPNITNITPPVPPPECTADADCPEDKRCELGRCISVVGACGYVRNHTFVPYECCLDTDCPAGKECRNNICIEKAPSAPPAQPPEAAQAQAALDAARAEIEAARAAGKEVSAAEQKLREAETAFGLGDFSRSLLLASEARAAAANATAIPLNITAPPAPGLQLPKIDLQLVTIVIGIIAFAAIALLGYRWFKGREGGLEGLAPPSPPSFESIAPPVGPPKLP
ncbi:MAG: S8 family serine peptidase [Candidatus Micrarchaeia archaeon]